MKPRIESHFSVTQQISYVFGKPYVPSEGEFLLNHCRCGILLALKSIGLHRGDVVGMMAYNCHTVMNAIDQAECALTFIDVNDDLTIDFEDLKKKVSGMKALIVTHLFGIINDVRKIKALYPDLVIIEDCAHAYGIDGIFGDFATFSFGQGKLPSIGDGGLLLVKNGKYLDRVAAQYDELLEYSWAQSVKLFLKLLLRSWMNSNFIYGWLTLPLKQRRPVASGKETVEMRKICRGVSAVYATEKDKLAWFIKRRKQKAKETCQLLSDIGIQQTMDGVNAFMLVVRCESPKVLQKQLYANGIDSATHFSHSLEWAEEFGYQKGSCPNVEKMLNNMLMIPVY